MFALYLRGKHFDSSASLPGLCFSKKILLNQLITKLFYKNIKAGGGFLLASTSQNHLICIEDEEEDNGGSGVKHGVIIDVIGSPTDFSPYPFYLNDYNAFITVSKHQPIELWVGGGGGGGRNVNGNGNVGDPNPYCRRTSYPVFKGTDNGLYDISSVSWSPDASKIAYGTYDGVIGVLDSTTTLCCGSSYYRGCGNNCDGSHCNTPIKNMKTKKTPVSSAEWRNDSTNVLLSTSFEDGFRIWDCRLLGKGGCSNGVSSLTHKDLYRSMMQGKWDDCGGGSGWMFWTSERGSSDLCCWDLRFIADGPVEVRKAFVNNNNNNNNRSAQRVYFTFYNGNPCTGDQQGNVWYGKGEAEGTFQGFKQVSSDGICVSGVATRSSDSMLSCSIGDREHDETKIAIISF